MKILELTNFTAGTCGVFSRVLEESKLLQERGHDVHIFSSNKAKGSEEIAQKLEIKNSIKITRFPTIKLGGESFMHWNFTSEALKLKPDLIIAHSYRHPHTNKALKIAKKLNIPIFLVTHAPFDANQTKRSLIPRLYIKHFYDPIIGKKSLNQFTKVISITNWESPILMNLGVKISKIEYIPNGIPNEFFTEKQKVKEQNKIVYLGRISQIKNLETLIRSMSLIKDKNISLELVGPPEKIYLKKLKSLIKELNLTNRISFKSPIYEIKEKIRAIDSAKLFVLPSIREGHPQSLIEALARKKLVIASKNPGNQDIISNNKTGFLFQTENEKDLAEKINQALSLKIKDKDKIKNKAQDSVKHFSWNLIIKKLEKLINKRNSRT